MKNGTVIFIAVVIGGCAAGTGTRESEDLEYRRADEQVEALERYDQVKRSCARSGGIVFLKRHNGGRLAKTPTAEELKGASCSPSTVF